MKSGRKDYKNRLLRAGESQDKEGSTVIHIMKMGDRNHFTVGNWN